MSAESTFFSTTSGIARIGLALLLPCLMVFPEGAAFAQTACPVSTSTWTLSGVPLPNITETLGAAVVHIGTANFMYVIGGENWNGGNPIFPTSVYHKLVGAVASTTPGTWFSSPLWNDPNSPTETVGLSRDLCGTVYTNTATSTSYVYTVGGVYFDSKTNQPFGDSTNQVWYNQIQSNGSLSNQWNSTTPIKLPVGVTGLQLHGTAVVTVPGTTNTYLYVIGGSTAAHGDTTVSQHVTNAVHYAQINSDGSLGQWDLKPLPNIPSRTGGNGVYKTCPVVYNGTIYVSGGEDQGQGNSSSLDQVVYAKPISDGTFDNSNTWTNVTSNYIDIGGTLTPVSPQAVVVHNNDIILMGGDQTGQGHDWATVLEGIIGTGGGVSWTNTFPPLPEPVSRNAGAVSGSLIFSLGGNHAGTDVQCVYYATAP
jgi:hypothetical protein